MSRYFDGARLTERQLEVASLAWEYEMSIGEIARRLGKHRSTIQERLAAAKIRIDRAGNFERRAAARAKRLD
jgi:IS30 family transposase